MKIKLPIETGLLTRLTTTVENISHVLNPEQRSKVLQNLLLMYFYINDKNIADRDNKYKTNSVEYKDIKYYQIPSITLKKKFDLNFNVFSVSYSHILDILEQEKLIEIDHSYQAGDWVSKKSSIKDDKGTCKAYRTTCNISTPDTNNIFVLINLDLDKIYEKKSKKQFLAEFNDPIIKRLISMTYDVCIDIKGFESYLLKNIGNILENGQLCTLMYASTILMQAHLINLQYFYFGVTLSGRFYSSLVNLSKIATPFIKYKSKQLVEIDASSMHIHILSTMFECDELKYACETGQFYSSLVGIADGFDTIEEAKKSFIKLLFSNRAIEDGVAQSIDKLYRDLPFFINSKKIAKHKISKIGKYGHTEEERLKLWWCVLQKIESDIFIYEFGKIAKNLGYEYITKHDAILIDENLSTDVIKIIAEIAYNKHDFNINLKKKKYEKIN